MSYTSTDPAAQLASRKWRIRHSAWLLAPLLGIGMLSFVGFVYIGLRVRTRKFWIALVVGCIGSATTWVIAEAFPTTSDGDGQGTWAGGVLLAVWIGLAVYAFILNRDYLRWRATRSEANAWYSRPISVGPATNMPLAPAPGTYGAWPAPTAAAIPPSAAPAVPTQGFLGADNSAFYAPTGVPHAPARPFSPPPAPVAPAPSPRPPVAYVDLNSAPAAEISATLHVDPTLADRIVAARRVHGGFRDLNGLAAAAGLQPHELIHLRGNVTFGPVPATAHLQVNQTTDDAHRPTAPHSPGSQDGGRILDY